MSKSKKTITLIFCMFFSLCFSVNVFAAEVTPTITLSNISAMPNDTVTVDIDIQNNPGIMGMAFSVTYDSDAFEFIYPEDDIYGGWLTGLTVKDHPDKGCIIFVYVTSDKNNPPDNTTNGKMLSVKFKIKEIAAPGRHTITLANNNLEKYGNKLHNSFSNSQQKYIIPTVKSGSITVGETCTNAGHKYGDWTITKPANCTETGLKNHTCVRDEGLCIASSRFEEVEIPITHDFESDWTIDEVATPDKDGVMTRHCTKCDEKTDRITFSYEEVGGDDKPTVSDTSSDTSSNESTVSQDSSSNFEQNSPPSPIINNTVGSKVPADVVVNLNDYQQNIKPNLNTEPPASDVDSSSSNQVLSTQSEPVVQAKPDPSPITPQKSNSFFATPAGIAIAVASGMVSVATIGLGIFLIIKNKS